MAEQQTIEHSSTLLETQRLPLFVYGTLRRGQPNYGLLRGHTLVEQLARVQGMSLYSMRAYPLAVRGSHTVIGELITLNPRIYHQLLTDLDALEGYQPGRADNLFCREIVSVETDNTMQHAAWMYVGNPEYLDEAHVLIPDGDWTAHRHRLVTGMRFGRFILEEDSHI